jgi:Trk-type K+ transport system membrane component
MAIGGMASSTAGGIKAIRVGIAFKTLSTTSAASCCPSRRWW